MTIPGSALLFSQENHPCTRCAPAESMGVRPGSLVQHTRKKSKTQLDLKR
jgi:hypothetical protein